ncbi:MAG: FHA domain-containing protein, partial [Gammaproteobacteria bacterium]
NKEQGREDEPDSRLSTSTRLKSLFKRPPQLKLRYRNKTHELGEHVGPFTFGRLADCDLAVREQRVSRFHARIELKDDQFMLTDESSNGTTVRFTDGRVERLKKTSAVLMGSGLFALGTEAVETNPHAIFFET